jgi:hypothetical protein
MSLELICQGRIRIRRRKRRRRRKTEEKETFSSLVAG